MNKRKRQKLLNKQFDRSEFVLCAQLVSMSLDDSVSYKEFLDAVEEKCCQAILFRQEQKGDVQ